MKPAPIYRYHLVGVFDVVGQSNIFQSFEGVPNESDAASPLASALPEVLGFFHWFRTAFQTTFDQTPFEKNPIAPYDRDLRKIETLLSETELKIQAFNDLLIPYTLLPPAHQHLRALSAIYRMLSTAGTLMVLCLAHGRALRGAIEAEGAVERASGEIYGRALNESLRLALREAHYPRILVGRGLYTYLSSLAQTTENSVFAERARQIARQALQWLMEESDHQLILHYLSPTFPAKDPETFRKARAFIEHQRVVWTNAGYPQWVEKYQQLGLYWQRFSAR